ncbi:MAG: hypothetical protein K1X75_09055 [Leptospirales bacterium]|nr:hypothetical protein [Leptospirales bacterium]
MSEYLEIADLNLEQFRRFAALIHDLAGISLSDRKITLLSNRLRRRLRALGMRDFDEYYRIIAGEQGGEELHRFLEAVTTNETYFWRTTPNFQLLREDLLPDLLHRFSQRSLRFWSAGSSSGEEAYNMAIELVEGMKKTGVFEFSIVGTDISERVVQFAREALYSGRRIEKVPAAILHRYFRPDADHAEAFRVRSDIRARVRFEIENLFQSKQSGMHGIFCRNVMIYFRREEQETLVRRFYDALEPGGYLVVGHSESLFSMRTGFELRNLEHGVAYQRPEAGGASER